MSSVFEQFEHFGVVPVLEIEQAAQAAELAHALAAGGLPIAEVTLRTPAALESIRQIAQHAPNVLLGAGTILTLEQARAACDAGARFLVSPGFVHEVVEWSLGAGIHCLPGAVTPTEITWGVNLGLSVLKFFPAGALGGVQLIEAMADPFGGLRFVTTGGIRPENMSAYLHSKRILAVGGSWMATRAMISAGQFTRIEELTRQSAEIVRSIRKSQGRD